MASQAKATFCDAPVNVLATSNLRKAVGEALGAAALFACDAIIQYDLPADESVLSNVLRSRTPLTADTSEVKATFPSWIFAVPEEAVNTATLP